MPHPAYDRFGKEIKEDMLSPYDTDKLFEDYLRDTYDINKPFIHRWKPEDKLSENDLKEIFNISKDNNFNTSFKNATDIFLSTNRHIDLLDFDTELVINNFYKKYESIYPNLKSIVNEDGPSLDDKFLRTIEYDRNIKGLLGQTNKRDVIIKKNTPFGLFEPFNGSGSGLGIKLEKDILMNEKTSKEYDTYLTYSYSNKFGDYSPISVYGYDIRNKHINTLEIPDDDKTK